MNLHMKASRHGSIFRPLRLVSVAFLFIALFTGTLIAGTDGFRVLSYGDDFTDIEFTLPDFEVYTVEHEGITYHRFYHPEHGLIMEEGLPELLSFSFLLSVPATGTVDVEEPMIEELQVNEDIMIFPSQGFDLEIDEKRGFLIDKEFYQQDVNYPEKRTMISSPAIMRDMRMVSINVNPFIYNPANQELEIVSRMTLRVNYNTGEVGENELSRPDRPKSRTFERLQRSSVLNYEQFRNPGTRNDYQQRSMIVVHIDTANNEYNHALGRYVNWKRDKGFKVDVISTADHSTNNAIKNYVQNAYDEWDNPPEYLVLIGQKGGTFGAPIWTVPHNDAYIAGNCDTDHPYSLLEGDDYLADILVGRISISSATQLATFWHKLENYEKQPYMQETDWYEQIVLVGDRRVGFNNTGISGFFTTRYLRETLERYNENYNFTEIYDEPFRQQMQDGITNGTTFFSFRGMETMAGWSSPQPGDVNNGYKLPNINVITCRTMNFTGGWRVGNLFRMGTPNEPRGAISALGMSWITDTAFNNNLTGALYRGLFVHNMRTMTEAKVYAKLEHYRAFWNSHQWRAKHYFEMLNYKGDPSMDVWKGIPQEMNVDYPEELPPGSNSIRIAVTDENDQPLEDVWVTIRQGTVIGEEDIFVTGYTDNNGFITHFFGDNTEGNVTLTVSKPDYHPYNGRFEITGNAGVTYNQLITNDDIVAGEVVNFVLAVRNHNNQAVNGVNGTISIDSEYVNITENSSAFGNIAANSNADSNDNYIIELSADTPAGYQAEFDLTVTDDNQNSWLSRFYLNINNGKLEIAELIIEDDDDGVLDPLEEARLNFRLTNSGNVDLDDLRATISGGGYGLDFLNDEAHYGDIAVGQTAGSQQQHIDVSTSSFVIPGMSYDLELHVFNEEGFSQRITFRLPIGTVTVDDPLGPCSYGYWIYDCCDEAHNEAPEYNWIEIAPRHGGAGVDANITADYDDVQNSRTMDLPFDFRFYGEEYDVITISANGWVTFKETELATQRNWRLPGPLGPDPIIAAFWDNIDIGESNNGAVYTYYDEPNGKFIIQWENSTNVQFDAENTFQIILYDPEYHFTTTNDGPIKIQYKVFNNVNNRGGQPHGGQSQYGEWGNFCTIGISDHTSLRGLEYTFNNEYPTAARELDDETALYISTGSLGFSPYVAIDNVEYISTDQTSTPKFGATGDFNIRLRNIGGQDAGNVRATLLSNDDYITITQDFKEFGDILSEQTSTVNNAYTIEIAENVPDKHRAYFTLNIEAEGNIEWNFRYHIDIAAPHLDNLVQLIYDPQPGGNNDGIVDPGEEFVIYLPVKNVGGANSPEVELTVVCDDPLVEIHEVSETFFNSILSGSTMYPAIQVSLSDEAELGTGLVFDYSLTTGEYHFEGGFLLGVGGIVPIELSQGDQDQLTGISEASPINIYFQSLRGQKIYTAEELRETGVASGGPITEFGFYIGGAPEYPLNDFVIRARHTDAVDARQHISGPYETLYSTESYNPRADRWDMIELDTPFEWNGIDNILIDTAFSSTQSWGSSGQVMYTEMENGYRYTRQDSPDQTDVETTDVSNKRPDARMLINTSAGDTSNRPENLTVNYVHGEYVQLNWDAPEDQENLLGYNVYRNGEKINEEAITDIEYQDRDYDDSVTNYYYVTAVYEERETLPSNIAGMTFNFTAKPIMSPEEGSYYKPFNLAMTSETEEADIYYTLDGSEPTTDSYLYENPFKIDYHTLVKAKAFADDLLPSETAIGRYYVLHPPRNLRAGGSLESVELSWEEPWSPDEDASLTSANNRQSRLEKGSRGDRHQLEADRQSRNPRSIIAQRSINTNSLRTEIVGYNVYRSKEEGEFENINDEPVEETFYNDTGLEETDYRYYVTAVYEVGESEGSKGVNVGPTSVDDEDMLPTMETKLVRAFPNPFNPETIIEFSLKDTDEVTIEIFDIKGKRVRILVEDTFDSGHHKAVWKGDNNSGRRLSSGVYFYRMRTSEYMETKKVLMLK